MKRVFKKTRAWNIYSEVYMSPEEIHKIRQRLKLTQQEFADALHVARESVARWEIGMSRPRGLYLMALQALAVKARKRAKRTR